MHASFSENFDNLSAPVTVRHRGDTGSPAPPWLKFRRLPRCRIPLQSRWHSRSPLAARVDLTRRAQPREQPQVQLAVDIA